MTSSEHIRDQDMEEWIIVSGVAQGLKEARKGTFVQESILDILRDE